MNRSDTSGNNMTTPANKIRNAPRVSVIMNCFNGERYLREAIESVFAQTYDNWEIVFWDNASTDGSAKIAKTYGPRLRYYKGDTKVPLGEARNYALKEVRGDYIAFLDCDDLWMPSKLQMQIPLFDDSKVGLVYSDAIYFNESGDQARFYEARPYYTGNCFSQLVVDYFLSMQTVVIRKKALDDMECWFDTQFDLSQDRDLFTRIGYKWKCLMVNQPLAKWRVHSASLSWKRGYAFADDIDIMLNKFSKSIPNFDVDYANELSVLRRKNIISKAMCQWQKGKNKDARRTLIPLLGSSIKAWLLTAATIFPELYFRKLLIPLRQTKIFPSAK